MPKPPTKRRRAVATASPSRKPRRAPHRDAARLADGILLSHFPFHHQFGEWIKWGGVAPPSARGAIATTFFERLRADHVFTYAGPPCFGQKGQPGDAVAYFGPSVDALGGFACPFDTGSLEPPTPRLQPWAKRSESFREQRVSRFSFGVVEWRDHFARWLTHCYPSNPMHYLDTSPDPYVAGTPQRTQPPTLGVNNGAAGQARHTSCADRRAWTWEVRFPTTVPFNHIKLVHVGRAALQSVVRTLLAHKLLGAEARALPAGVTVGHDALYQHSGSLLRKALP